MQMLVRRYVTAEQKKLEEFAVTEDDIAEVRHDISTLRFELIDIFRQNKFTVPKINADDGKSHYRSGGGRGGGEGSKNCMVKIMVIEVICIENMKTLG